ncbi:MAG: hypothetical protein HOE80_04360 [Candidatus Magasanikbacteria bacterium]|jgi:hypothetical protein|nr:hypothetical protein [Candidatus Magasanikbacteria bacterium]MBT4071926.1 hypothetical protein [Candidatus Magasanikbacteria bacterium]
MIAIQLALEKIQTTLRKDIHLSISTLITITTLLTSLLLPQTVSAEQDLPYIIFPQTKRSYPISKNAQPRAEYHMLATAYSSDPYQTDSTPFLPANGVDYRATMEKQGFVAAIASNDLPLGTIVAIPTEMLPPIFTRNTNVPTEIITLDDKNQPVMFFTVTDRMNKKFTGKGRFDIYVASADADGNIDQLRSRTIARSFGARRMIVGIMGMRP